MWLLLFFLFFFSVPTNTKVITITDEKELEKLIQEDDTQVIVEFSANWCSACTQVKKPFEEVAAESEFNKIIFVCINIEQASPVLCKKYCNKYCNDGIPAFVYFDCGKQKEKEIGVKDIHIFKDHLRNNLRKNFTSTKQQAPSRVTLLLPGDKSPVQKNKQDSYVDICNSIINNVLAFVSNIKEWIGC